MPKYRWPPQKRLELYLAEHDIQRGVAREQTGLSPVTVSGIVTGRVRPSPRRGVDRSRRSNDPQAGCSPRSRTRPTLSLAEASAGDHAAARRRDHREVCGACLHDMRPEALHRHVGAGPEPRPNKN